MAPPADNLRASSRRRRIGRLLLPLILGAATVVMLIRPDQPIEKLPPAPPQEKEIAIAVTFINMDDGLHMPESRLRTVRLLVAGSSDALAAMNLEETACIVDLGGLGQGGHTLPIHPENIRLPQQIALSMLLTPTLTVRLEAISKKRIDVIAVLEGRPAPGYAVAGVTLKPDTLVLEGTAAALTGIEQVRTQPISLNGASESFKREIPLNLPAEISAKPSRGIVLVQVQIAERIVTRRLENIPVVGKGTYASLQHQIRPATIALTVRGPEAVVGSIENHPEFAVTIDLRGLDPDQYRLAAVINLPIGITLIEARPKRFSVIISK